MFHISFLLCLFLKYIGLNKKEMCHAEVQSIYKKCDRKRFVLNEIGAECCFSEDSRKRMRLSYIIFGSGKKQPIKFCKT